MRSLNGNSWVKQSQNDIEDHFVKTFLMGNEGYVFIQYKLRDDLIYQTRKFLASQSSIESMRVKGLKDLFYAAMDAEIGKIALAHNQFLVPFTNQLHIYNHVFKKKLLPAPFKSDCINYKEGNQKQCIFPCLHKITTSRFNESIKIKNYWVEAVAGNVFIDDFNIDHSECERNCSRLDCDSKQTEYFTALKHKSRLEQPELIYYGNHLEISTEYKPMLNIIDLIVSLASIIGIWLGLSCMNLLDVHKLVYSLLNKYKRRRLCDAPSQPVIAFEMRHISTRRFTYST